MYHNPFASGYEVFSKTSYTIDSRGSLADTARYLISNDFPDYAAMFYSPTDHEVFSQIKYGNFSQDYSNLREVQASLNGPPIEFYMPSHASFADGAGSQNSHARTNTRTEFGTNSVGFGTTFGGVIKHEDLQNNLMKTLFKEAANEIIMAQKQAKSVKIKVEFEDVLVIRKRKRTITFEQGQ